MLLPILGSYAAAAAPPAGAAVTLRIQSRSQLKPFTSKSGYSFLAPDSWAVAYDRSQELESGTQVLLGSFRTFDTLSVTRSSLEEAQLQQLAPGAGGLDAAQVADAVLAEYRDNQSTYGFKVLAAQPRPTPPAAQADGVAADGSSGSMDGSSAGGSSGRAAQDSVYDIEFVVQVCRGNIEEELGGSKRCVGPKDMDLQVVSRHYVMGVTAVEGVVYLVKGSATSDRWPQVAPDILAAVRSFTPPARAAA